MLKTILSNRIVRQLMGAAGGALVALTLFTAYRTAAPMVTAFVLPEDVDVEGMHPAPPEDSFEAEATDATEEFAATADSFVVSETLSTVAQNVVASAPATTATAPALPDSGIGPGLMLLLALFLSVAIRKARQSRSAR